MIPSPFTAELARQHRAALLAARPVHRPPVPRRRPGPAAAAAATAAALTAAVVRRLPSLGGAERRPAACATC